jgi:hypothetical protein
MLKTDKELREGKRRMEKRIREDGWEMRSKEL